MPQSPLRLGMLGMWHTHAHGMVRQIAIHPDEFALSAAWDPDPSVADDRTERWRQLLPGLRLCPTAADVLSEPLDGVLVEGQVADNIYLARLAIDSGRPVLLEKPAGVDVAGFAYLARVARARGLHLQLAYLFRYMSAVRHLLSLADSGALGHIYQFRGRLPKDLRLYAEHEAELARYPGGILFEMAGHLVDIMVSLLGAPREIHSFLAHHHDAPGAFVDHGQAVCGFERAWGSIEVPALESAPDCRRIEVYGTTGGAIIPHLGSGHVANQPFQQILVYQKGQTGWQAHELPAATLQITDLREFAAVVSGQRPPEYTLDHDLVVQRALVAACSGEVRGLKYQSSHDG